MTKAELVIRNVRTIGHSGQVDVAVDQGKIIAIEKNLTITGAKELKGKGCLLLPGFVDLHMHLTMAFEESDEHKPQTIKEIFKDKI